MAVQVSSCMHQLTTLVLPWLTSRTLHHQASMPVGLSVSQYVSQPVSSCKAAASSHQAYALLLDHAGAWWCATHPATMALQPSTV